MFTLKSLLKNIYLILRHQPFIKCPACKGNGGEMSGYYEPEWDDCNFCSYSWEELHDDDLQWFIGRTSFINYISIYFHVKFGMWQPIGLWNLIKCQLGYHEFIIPYGHESEDIESCCFCWTLKQHGKILTFDEDD